MKLLTKAILKVLPDLYVTENQPFPMVHVKYFLPDADYTFYVLEFSPIKNMFYGLTIMNGEAELGYTSLHELERVRGKFHLHVERDLYWTPVTLNEVMRKHGIEF